ncbi:hypothetical protein LINGRAHAP2_LOCUS854, partial [Linum grandiflorum]
MKVCMLGDAQHAEEVIITDFYLFSFLLDLYVISL